MKRTTEVPSQPWQTQQHHRGSLVTARNWSRLDTISLASLRLQEMHAIKSASARSSTSCRLSPLAASSLQNKGSFLTAPDKLRRDEDLGHGKSEPSPE